MPVVRTVITLTLGVFIFWAGSGLASAQSFLNAAQLNINSVLPPPPADGSAAQKSELQILHTIQQTRTPAEVAAAEADAAQKDMLIFRTALGPSFSPGALPLTMAFSQAIAANEPPILKAAKHFFDRERPFVADPTLHNVCPADSASYPSSHSTDAFLQARVLAAMVPEMRDAIFARAENYAYNRLVCGVHYPSDVQAGKTVAGAMIGPMMENPAFQAQFASAQTELRTALNLPPLPPPSLRVPGF